MVTVRPPSFFANMPANGMLLLAFCADSWLFLVVDHADFVQTLPQDRLPFLEAARLVA